MNISSRFSRLGISLFSPHSVPFRLPEPSYPLLLSQISTLVRHFIPLVQIFFFLEVLVDSVSVLFRSHNQIFIRVGLGSVYMLSRHPRSRSSNTFMAALRSPDGQLLPSLRHSRLYPFRNRGVSNRALLRLDRFWEIPVPGLSKSGLDRGRPILDAIRERYSDPMPPTPSFYLPPEIDGVWQPFLSRGLWLRRPRLLSDSLSFDVLESHPDSIYLKSFTLFDRFFRFISVYLGNQLFWKPFLDFFDREAVNWKSHLLFALIRSLLLLRGQPLMANNISMKSIWRDHGPGLLFFAFADPSVRLSLSTYLGRNLFRIHRRLHSLFLQVKVISAADRFSAQFLGAYVARRFSLGYSVRQVITRPLIRRILSYYRGVRFVISGRFSKKLRADYFSISAGSVPLNSFGVPVTYNFSFGVTRHGCVGVKIWFGAPLPPVPERLSNSVFRSAAILDS